MFQRVIIEHWMAIFPLVAFITAGSVYVVLSLKAFRMQPSKLAHFEQLPFGTERPSRDEKQS